jgi:protein gp37
MSAKTSIEWTGRTWNPLVAYLTREVEVTRKNGEKVKIPAGTRGWFCSKCSPGCLNCYAEKINLRLGNGLTYQLKNLADIEFRLVNLDAPLRWKKPGFVFVNSMTDLFHEAVPRHLIDQVFAAMALASNQTFQVLTKRAAGMREYLRGCDGGAHIGTARTRIVQRMGEICAPRFPLPVFPLPNVWLGVSAENQKYWNERVAELINTPAAVRFVSAEPLLGPIDINPETHDVSCGVRKGAVCDCTQGRQCRNGPSKGDYWSNQIDWVICGGESGSKARPCNLEWLRGILGQCNGEMIPCFVKQVGSNPIGSWPMAGNDGAAGTVNLRRAGFLSVHGDLKPFRHSKGADTLEWPEDLRVRQMPEVKNRS